MVTKKPNKGIYFKIELGFLQIENIKTHYKRRTKVRNLNKSDFSLSLIGKRSRKYKQRNNHLCL